MVALLFVLPLLASCDLPNRTVEANGTVAAGLKFDGRTFGEQRRLWRSSGTKDYSYDLAALGYISYEGTVSVVNGDFKGDDPDWGTIEEFLEYSTIDKVYDEIEAMFLKHKDAEQSKSDFHFTEIAVEYDTANHIPTKIFHKYYCPPNLAVDGTFVFEIRNFAGTK